MLIAVVSKNTIIKNIHIKLIKLQCFITGVYHRHSKSKLTAIVWRQLYLSMSHLEDLADEISTTVIYRSMSFASMGFMAVPCDQHL